MTTPRPPAARTCSLAVAVAAAVIAATPTTAVAAADALAPPPVFRGSWIATVGANTARPFHGEWSAQALPGRPDDVQGSWSLLGPDGDVAMKGTWAARRAKRGMKGTWSARLPSGGVFSGSFEAIVPGFKGKTFQDLLAATSKAQLAGTWRMGAAARQLVAQGVGGNNTLNVNACGVGPCAARCASRALCLVDVKATGAP